MTYRQDVARIAQQACDDYPGEEARDDRYVFIDQEAEVFLMDNPMTRKTAKEVQGDIQDAVECLLEGVS